MGRSKLNILFFVFLISIIFFFVYEDRLYGYIETFYDFKLSEVELETMAEISLHIPEGMDGYVVFYSKAIHCYSCVREMNGLKTIAEIYPELGYYAVVNGDDHRKAFAETMTFFQIPGDYLVDPQGRIARRLGLGDHPMLMFFNSDQRLVAVLPMDVDQPNLLRQMHFYISAM